MRLILMVIVPVYCVLLLNGCSKDKGIIAPDSTKVETKADKIVNPQIPQLK
jgi:hypothetical protein